LTASRPRTRETATLVKFFQKPLILPARGYYINKTSGACRDNAQPPYCQLTGNGDGSGGMADNHNSLKIKDLYVVSDIRHIGNAMAIY
jgi:hypothetical protein